MLSPHEERFNRVPYEASAPDMNGPRFTSLREELAAIGSLQVDRVELPETEVSLRITRPEDFDLLLDTASDDPEQNLPYWAELWPSGIALAAAIARDPESVRDLHVLELGCGLGVTAIAALRAGAELLVTDYSADALNLCALNTLDQAGREPRSLQVNWRDPNAGLIDAAPGGFPVVLAADVLYESRDVEPLLTLVEQLVSRTGTLWLAEPGRRPAAAFLEQIVARGWSRTSVECAGPWPDPEDNRKGVVVGLHRLTRRHLALVD